MKADKSLLWSFILLAAIAALYRVIPNRPFGFAPQIAMAIFSGSIVKDKKYSFLLPLFSMLLSDVIYELLFVAGLAEYGGFYEGQVVNYLLFISLTVIGFFVNKFKWMQIFAGSLVATVAYFLLSNFAVWIGGGLGIKNLPYPKTMSGLAECMAAGLPFLKGSFYATLFFSTILFGGYYLVNKYYTQKEIAVA